MLFRSVVVIASSDSDFAPLVSRLREKGCRVIGVGQEGKTGDETIGVYDDYEVMAHRRPAARAASTKAPAKAPAKKSAAKKVPAKQAVAAIPDKAQAILDALPGLANGESVELRVAAERLRDVKLLSKNGSSTKLFGQFPELFRLWPEKQPNHVHRLIVP